MSWYPIDETGACVLKNGAGVAFESLPCLYNDTLGRTYPSFERDFDPVHVRDWMVRNPWAPIAAVITYGALILAGRLYFQDRPAWNWRKSMAMWNLSLSVFSAFGLFRTLPQLIHNFYYYSIPQNLCFDPESNFGSGTTGLWVQYFVLSKFPELFDTFFIIIHKKPLMLLHWYHHISVLLYCWLSYVTNSPSGLIFAVMNYSVHALMYFYYFLMAVKLKPKWFNSMYITIAQISQMVVGVTVTLTGFFVQPNYPAGQCWLTWENNIGAFIMYGSYLLLFVQFFIDRYSIVPASKKKVQ